MSWTRRTALTAAWLLLEAPYAPGMAGPAFLGFDGLYRSRGVRGLEFSEALLALRGQAVAMTGYMAPPLKAESSFFVLTAQPMSLCPFCASDADWPDDIVVVHLAASSPLTAAGSRLTVTGRLEAGSATDPATGFVSLIRLMDARYALARD
jgi:hypothetical protein